MAAGGFGVIFLMMSLAMQGANDMADYVRPAAYWEARGVEMNVDALSAQLGETKPQDISALIKDLGADNFETREAAQKKIIAMGPVVRDQVEAAMKSGDPEVKMRAEAILKSFAGRAENKALSRLMAIKALGELKDAKAAPVLKPLLASKEPFVADYAAESIALIEGKPYKRPQATEEQLKSDLALLPPNCAIVGQIRFAGGTRIDFEKALADIPADALQGRNKEDLLKEVSGLVEQGLAMVGNIRGQAVTFGLSDDLGPRGGSVVFVGRGLYERDPIRKLIMDEMRQRPVQNIEGVEVLQPDRDVGFIMPGPDRFIIVGGEGRANPLPFEPVAKALAAKEPVKGVESNEEMAKLLASVDRTKPIWAVARMTESYRTAPMLAPFDTMTLVGEEKDGSMFVTLVAVGKDLEAIKAAVDQFEQLRQEIVREITREADRMPPLKPLADMFNGIKMENAGNKVTLTAELKGGSGTLLTMPMLIFMAETQCRPAPMAPRAVPMERQPVFID